MILLLFIGLSMAFNYSAPITIDNGIQSTTYPVAYDQKNDLILFGNGKTMYIYDLTGKLVNQFNVVNEITSMDITTYDTILVLTTPDNVIFDYDYSGTLIKTTFFGGFNGGSTQVLCHQKLKNFYVWYSASSFYVVYSFNENHQVISHAFIDKDVTGWHDFNIGELTGNLMYSTYQTIQIYNSTLNIVMNVTLDTIDPYPHTIVTETTNSIATYFNYNSFTQYFIPDGTNISTVNTHNYLSSNVVYWYDQNYYITIWIKSKNNKDIPYIVFFSSDGNIVNTMDFCNDGISAYYNMYVYINQETGTIVANINSEIKIWKLNK